MSSDSSYNYGVIGHGIYETRHAAVGAAAVLNRELPWPMHRVVVLPDIIGAMENLPNHRSGGEE